MAITDLIEKFQNSGGRVDDPEDMPDVDVPDDLSELSDEPDDILPPDPKPSKKGPTKQRASTAKVTITQKRQLKDSLMLMMGVPAGMLSLRDPVCGNAVLDNAENIADKLVPIIARNPGMLTWFLGSGAPYMDFMALAMALKPVATTVWSHHVTKTLHGDDDGGFTADDFSQYQTSR